MKSNLTPKQLRTDKRLALIIAGCALYFLIHVFVGAMKHYHGCETNPCNNVYIK